MHQSWQVNHPDGAVSAHGARGSWLACIVAGRFITPRRRFRIAARRRDGSRVSYLAGTSPLRKVTPPPPIRRIMGVWPQGFISLRGLEKLRHQDTGARLLEIRKETGATGTFGNISRTFGNISGNRDTQERWRFPELLEIFTGATILSTSRRNVASESRRN